MKEHATHFRNHSTNDYPTEHDFILERKNEAQLVSIFAYFVHIQVQLARFLIIAGNHFVVAAVVSYILTAALHVYVCS